MRDPQKAQHLRQHLSLRRNGDDLRAASAQSQSRRRARAVLPLHVSRTARSRIGAELRRGRSGWSLARDHRNAPGERDDQALPPGYKFDPTMEITPRDVKSMLDKRENFVFIDCRLPNEYQITHIDGTKLLPLQELGNRIGEIKNHLDDKIVVHCKSGGR